MEEIFVPAAGMAMEEALLVQWLKEPGDEVATGEIVALVDTDKATVELEAPAAGKLGRHLFEAGSQVKVGTTIAYVLAEGEAEPGGGAARASLPLTAAPDQVGSAAPVAESSQQPARDDPGGRRPHSLSPRQRMAQAASSAGTPPPVSSTATSPAAGAGASPPDFRQAIAAAVSASWRDMPHFAVARDVDAERLLRVHQRAKERLAERVTITDLLIFALGEALVSTGREPNVGLAVSTDRGVVAMVIPSISSMSLSSIATARSQLVERARSGRALAQDSSPALITLSNLGAEGVSWFTGIIPQGQQGLLTTGAVTQRAVVRSGAVVVASELTAVLTVDHRSLDGIDAARVLRAFAEQLENLTEAVLR